MDSALLEQDPLAWLRAQPAAPSPLQTRVLEALANRAAAAEAPLRQELLRRLRLRVSRLGAADVPSPLPSPLSARRPSPLSELLSALGVAADTATPELRTLSTQRRSWARLSLQQRLGQAAPPAEAAQVGPLHAHALVPRALSLLGQLSPDYLQRLVAQVDSLAALAPFAVADAEAPRAGATKTGAAKTGVSKTGSTKRRRA